MTNLAYRRGDLASVIVLLLRVAKNDDNETFDSFDDQLRGYLAMARHGAEDNTFLQNIAKIADLRRDPEIAQLMDNARDAIADLLVPMANSGRWHDCGVIDPLHILELAGLASQGGSNARLIARKATKPSKKKTKSNVKKKMNEKKMKSKARSKKK